MAKIGRPSPYGKHILIKAKRYLNIERMSFIRRDDGPDFDDFDDEEGIEGEKKKTRRPERSYTKGRYDQHWNPTIVSGVPEVVPTIEGLALYLNVGRQTIYDWCKDPLKKDFSYIVEQIMVKQGSSLAFGGLTERFNAKIAALMLSKHGYKERHDVTTDDQSLNASGEAQGMANKALDAFLNGEITRPDTK